MNDNYSRNSPVTGEGGQRAARGERSEVKDRQRHREPLRWFRFRGVVKFQCDFGLEVRKELEQGVRGERRGWQSVIDAGF